MLPWLSKGTLRRQTCAFYIVFLMFSDVAPKWAQDAIRRRPWTPARSTKGRPESLSRMPCRQNLQVTYVPSQTALVSSAWTLSFKNRMMSRAFASFLESGTPAKPKRAPIFFTSLAPQTPPSPDTVSELSALLRVPPVKETLNPKTNAATGAQKHSSGGTDSALLSLSLYLGAFIWTNDSRKVSR
jgi:hypothetical protein